tara:strand:- start:436 stop:720 length:285 start_codon:yes stop_codon:yes gene_type:complete
MNTQTKGNKMNKQNIYAVVIHGVSKKTGAKQMYITTFPFKQKGRVDKFVTSAQYGNLFKHGVKRVSNEKYISLKTQVVPSNNRGITELELVKLI